MCGIVGVLGEHEAAPILVEALRRLEYRGYDSAGIATLDNGVLDRRRAVGKLANLADLLVHNPIKGHAGIGHTRWATHGAATEGNAHPHRAGPVAVVHNGIIENFKELREDMAKDGITFQTDTDTECVAKYCERELSRGASPKEAAANTLKALQGAYALCFLFDGEEDLMIAARQGSPLAIGHANDAVYVGSDAIALAPMTGEITYLEEGDWAVLTRSSVEIYDREGRLANREKRSVSVDAGDVGKGNHKHFMSKEIFEQPTVLANVVSKYVDRTGPALALHPIEVDFTKADRVVLVACGTAYLACQVAKYWFEQHARIPVELDIASEFRYREPPLTENTIAIFVSQSGETADTLAALRYCIDQGAKTVGIVNVPESTIAREADIVLPIHAGREIGVASTKAFTCQLAVLCALGIHAAQQRGITSAEDAQPLIDALTHMPSLVNQALDTAQAIETVAKEISHFTSALFLGRGAMYPIALEGALKLKEISYIHAEGYASGELKHGPIALVDENMPVIVFAPKDALFEKTISNMQEVMARGGKIVLFTDRAGAEAASDGVWRVVTLPSAPDRVLPLLYAVPAQLLAYYTAVHKGTDVDQPRNLAKSVTVE
ncbi:MAG: glutamine--fructose-6-phosphate transaminase (isomerizing) [Pseudomonadota bacterium]